MNQCDAGVSSLAQSMRNGLGKSIVVSVTHSSSIKYSLESEANNITSGVISIRMMKLSKTHQTTRIRKRVMHGFKSVNQAQRFLDFYLAVFNLFNLFNLQ